jgi:hypothetical protein
MGGAGVAGGQQQYIGQDFGGGLAGVAGAGVAGVVGWPEDSTLKAP